MDCTAMEALFSAYYDEALDELDKRAFETHIRTCESCEKSFRDYCFLMNKLHDIPPEPLPEGFHESTMKLLPRESKPTALIRLKRPVRVLRQYTWAAASVCACFILISVLASGFSGFFRSPGSGVIIAESDYAAAASGGSYSTASVAGEPESIGSATPFVAPASEGAGYVSADAHVSTASSVSESVQRNVSVLSEGLFEQNFHIEIMVDNLQEAAAAIDRLNGYNTSANLYYNEPSSGGNFVRRVEAGAYGQAKDLLRELGTVINESESVSRMSANASDLEAQLKAKEAEVDRLMALLGKSNTLDVLAAVERRLGQVEEERDQLRGQLNGLYGATAHPYLYINLYEAAKPQPILPEESFGDRLKARFVRSINASVAFMENSLVFLSGAFIPLLLSVGLAGLVLFLVFRVFPLHRRGKVTVQANEGGDDDEQP